MKAYIINLQSSQDRKKLMIDALKDVPLLEYEFIEGVDGRLLSQSDLKKEFNIDDFKNIYYRDPFPGEIGCTLSHQKCYKKLIKSNNNYIIIFEDDIIINKELIDISDIIDSYLNVNKPRILLLSGWYWFSKKTDTSLDKYKLATVIDGFLTHSYGINKSAAEILTKETPNFLADAWKDFKKKGIEIMAIYPHIIDQDWENIESIIRKDSQLPKFKLCQYMKIKYIAAKRKLLEKAGYMERPMFMDKRLNIEKQNK